MLATSSEEEKGTGRKNLVFLPLHCHTSFYPETGVSSLLLLKLDLVFRRVPICFSLPSSAT